MSGTKRWYVAVLSLLAVVLVTLPGFLPNYRDSFPLSNYPMFTKPRHQVRVERLLGVAMNNKGVEEEQVIPSEFLGAFEVMQAASIIRKAVRGGRDAQRKLCRQVASKIAEDPRYSDMSKLVIVREFYHPVQFFLEDASPIQRRTIDHCMVRNRGKPRP